MPDSEIPPAAQSVAGIIDLHHQIAEAHMPHGTSIGKIISPPPNIEIAWNDIIIKKDRIYIDEYLLKGHTREAKGHITSKTQLKMCAEGDEPPVSTDGEEEEEIGGEDSEGISGGGTSATDAGTNGQPGTCCSCIYCNRGCSHAHKIDDDYKGTLTLTDTLKEGDLVEVTPLFGDQLFIVKCKLIYLGDSDNE